jgi:hypothetical protein
LRRGPRAGGVPWPSSALRSAAGFAVFRDGQTGRGIEEGGIGAAISRLLLGGALSFPAAFG